MQAAIYLRVSTEDQAEKFGLEVQRERCEAMAKVKGWNVAETFADEGLSGALDVTERPGLLALMEAAAAGAIDAVIVGSLDRLGRQTRIVLGVVEQLASLNVELLSCRENLDTSTPSGQFVLTMFAGLAQLEKDTIRERTMSGSAKAVQQGNVITGGSRSPYGYDVASVDGTRTLVVNEAEAEVVRQIFALYASGEETLLGLCKYLDSRDVPNPTKGNNHQAVKTGERWSTGTLRGILTNETYVGRWYYRKTKRIKQANGKYTTIDRPRSEWLLVEVPAIIDEKTFNLVKDRRKANKRQLGRRQRYTYPLGGKLTCSRCGSGVSGISRPQPNTVYRYYKCNARHMPKRYGFTCDLPTIRIEELDATVWQWVSLILLTPGRLRQEWDKHRQQAQKEAQPLIDMIEANTRKIEGLQAERRRLVKAYREGVLTLEDLAADKTDIERTIEQYAKANEELEADIAGRVPDEVEFGTIEEYASELVMGAEEGLENPEGQHRLYRAINLKGVVIYEDGDYFIDVSCVLGRERLSTVSSTAPRNEYCCTIMARLRVATNGEELAEALFTRVTQGIEC